MEGQGELVAQLRWYPGGWSNEEGPVGDAYEVLNEAMVPDNGPLTVEAGTEDQPLPLNVRSNGGLALVVKSVNSGSGRLGVAEVAYETIVRAVQTYVVLSCDTDGVWNSNYAYGFNGQRKTDEISGPGNHNTAMFWEYDTRLGLRWNTDPVVKPWQSPYNTFDGNPIYWSDPDGDCTDCPNKDSHGRGWSTDKKDGIAETEDAVIKPLPKRKPEAPSGNGHSTTENKLAKIDYRNEIHWWLQGDVFNHNMAVSFIN